MRPSWKDAREGVREAVLFTDVGNIPARKAYEAIGFRRIGSFRIVLLAHPIGVELR